jgi:hypothetical protein
MKSPELSNTTSNPPDLDQWSLVCWHESKAADPIYHHDGLTFEDAMTLMRSKMAVYKYEGMKHIRCAVSCEWEGRE